MTITNENVHCLWPRQSNLQDFLFLLGYDPVQSWNGTEYDFPWNHVLSLFNEIYMKNFSALKDMLVLLNFDFLYDDTLKFHENLGVFKEFFQFISPISCSATEGDHRIELANRLLYGMELKQEIPFLETVDDFKPLPFDSTVFKPISACVYLPCKIWYSDRRRYESFANSQQENSITEGSLHQRQLAFSLQNN